MSCDLVYIHTMGNIQGYDIGSWFVLFLTALTYCVIVEQVF